MAVPYTKTITSILAILFISFSICSCVSAQDSEKYYTNNHINGLFWKRFDFNEKLHYLYGIIDGISVISKAKPVLDEAHNYSPKVTEGILASTGRFFVPNGTYDDIIAFLDHFYSNEGNMRTPVYAAYAMYLADKKGWAALNKWDETLGQLKRGSAAGQP